MGVRSLAVSTGKQTVAGPKSVTILGSTGSVGCQTIDLLQRNSSEYDIVALTANTNVELLSEQALMLKPQFVVIGDENFYGELKLRLSGTDIEVAAGPRAIEDAANLDAEWVMAAIVGAAGLAPTLRATQRGAIVALANKECLVCAGELFMREVVRCEATLLPVDSEHNAIYQVFDFEQIEAIEKLILTASGGPFRDWEIEEMRSVTPSQAVAHPNWDMGAKISVDSATMMNKGLEVIEAHHIFGMPSSRIDVLVHPQSVIHSMVSYVDGSVLAQLGSPDMRTPIAYTLAWPSRIETPSKRLDLGTISTLQFEAPDERRFPALRLAREALQTGGAAATILNAANEVAVDAFLAEQIGFLEITNIVEETMGNVNFDRLESIDDVFHLDATARNVACVETEKRAY
ncbi:MAG: 1-deoxy-D-xylulose-5-phosphate reductoisomerase [Rickettsiales bacterium]|nr:1-deoxy-D-xylulose-5-phosphate reductoisomerase [Rickettsiales bacterium]